MKRAQPAAEPIQPAGPSAGACGPAADAPLTSFEASTERLAQIVDALEHGDLPLEQSLRLFEEGVRLLRSAEERLDQAERRVEELLGFDTKGKPVTRELAVLRAEGAEDAGPGE